jgi:hypothetical protein
MNNFTKTFISITVSTLAGLLANHIITYFEDKKELPKSKMLNTKTSE